MRDAQSDRGLGQLDEQIALVPTLAPPLFGVAQAVEALRTLTPTLALAPTRRPSRRC